MALVSTVYDMLQGLERRSRRLYTALFIAGIGIIFGLFVYRYTVRVEYYRRAMSRVNKDRDAIRGLMERSLQVKKQQEDVESLLTKDKNFLIAQYVTTVLQSMGLSFNLSKQPDIAQEDINKDYNQITLTVSLANVSMQQLVEFLNKVEQNPRVYSTSLEILKSSRGYTIDAVIVLATLQAKSTSTE